MWTQFGGWAAAVLSRWAAQSGRLDLFSFQKVLYQYSNTWQVLHPWCEAKKRVINPFKAQVREIFIFLHSGLYKGLSTRTLKPQAIVGAKNRQRFSRQPQECYQGAALLNPPVGHWFPTWSLNTMLKVFSRCPWLLFFLSNSPLKLFSYWP